MRSNPLATLRAAYFRHRHTSLLIVIVAAMAVRPLIEDTGAGPIAFSIAMLLMLGVVLTTIEVEELSGDRKVLLAQRRRRAMIAWGLAIPAAFERVYAIATWDLAMLA